MAAPVDMSVIHQKAWSLFAVLVVGWIALFLGTRRWGARFAAAALALGLLIPASRYLLEPGDWRALLDPELAAWNAGVWLAPAGLVLAWAFALRSDGRRRALREASPPQPAPQAPSPKGKPGDEMSSDFAGYRLYVRNDDRGMFAVFCDELPHLVAFGATEAQALENGREALREALAARR